MTIAISAAPSGRRSVKGSLAALTLAAGLLLALVAAGTAQANSPIYSYSVTPKSTQAGGHPDIEVALAVGNRQTQGFPDPCFCNDPKTVTAHLPTGVVGNPHVTPRCTAAQFAAFECPIDSQIGIQAILLFGELGDEGAWAFVPLYNMIPQETQAGLLQFPAPLLNTPISVELAGRTESDYGLDGTTYGIERLVPIYKIVQILWGVPAATIHDPLRNTKGFQCEEKEILPELLEGRYPIPCMNGGSGPEPTSSNSPLLPFMSNPTVCGGQLPISLDSLSFDGGTDFAEALFPAVTGCDQLNFNPSLSAKPTTGEADAPSGIDIDLSVPQLQSPTTPSPSQIKATTVTLPPGFTLNPNAADGKTSCTDAEARIGARDEEQCPEFSKIGTATIDSSALPGPISGYVYLGEPRPGDRYRLILTADGFATHIKLLGSAVPDPQTGQLVTTFPSLPQSPLTEFKMHLFGSERGLLATPDECGTYAVHSTFTPWDGALPDQEATQFFDIDSGPTGAACPSSPPRFEPRFAAASAGNTAGAHRPFSVMLDREDGDQLLSGLEITTPLGFSATLKGIPYCPESALTQLQAGYSRSGLAEVANPACPQASQIGVATGGAGAGSRPVYVGGRVYLAGPYKGAPLSLEVVIPAVSGPYDLGTIAVRVAIHVNPMTAQVTAVSDPLPQIFGGVPLRTRSLRVDLDRPDFALNPTSCDPLSVNARVTGDAGTEVTRSANYQVANCAILPSEPKLSLKLSDGVRRRGHPAISAVLTTEPGEANLEKVVATLPKGELLDNSHIGTVCTRVNFAADTCPPGSKIGRVEVITPLLDQPLRGFAYLRSSQHDLPDVALDLEGQIDIEAAGRIDSVDGRLRTTFEAIPDVPFSRITLDLDGGSKGLLQNSKTLCGAKKSASVKTAGQNGASTKSQTRLRIVGCGAKRPNKRHIRTGA